MHSKPQYALTVGFKGVQGKRPEMEDEHYANLNCIDPKGQYKSCAIFAVYDGHGGARVSTYLKQELHCRLLSGLVKGDEPSSICKVFGEMDNYLVEKSISEGSWADGSTAVVALIVDGVLFVANVGDSEGTLVKKQEEGLLVIPVTTIHKASDPSEQQRIQELGGKVFFGRVFGMLAVSRAFGDIQYKPPKAEKPYVNAEPAIFRIEIDETCKYLILACDGLWDVCNHKEAAQLVDNWVSRGKNLMEAANLLAEYALTNESSDNVSVVIIQIHWGDAIPKALETAAQLSSSTSQIIPVKNSSKRPSIHSNANKPLPPQVDVDAFAKERGTAPITPGPLIGTVEAPVYLKTLVGVTKIYRSYFYMSSSQHYFCTTKLGTQFPLPCWISQELISRKLFGESGVRALKLTEKFHQQFFVWATEFSNVHTTFTYPERLIVIDGVSYPGPEHYFQIQKSVGTRDEEKVKLLMKTANPDQAYGIGRSCQMRPGWEERKDQTMFEALMAKFTQQEDLKHLLLETGENLLVQLKPNDAYWGTGPDGRGKNKHAAVLMGVRDIIREQLSLSSNMEIETM